ncbi:MAG: acyltransferase family protein [Clostridia bacterium]|nr:acyltransferase family protein [Clostridia bacterium]
MDRSVASSARIYKYDHLRAVLMLLVVAGHLIDCVPDAGQYPMLCRVSLWIYGFHMPAFIFLSGLFYKDGRAREKAVQFFAIGLLMRTVMFLVRMLLFGDTGVDVLHESGAPWYMYVMGCYQLVMALLRGMNRKALLPLAVLASLMIGYTAAFGDFLALTRAIAFFPLFLLGTMIDRERLCAATSRVWLKLPAAALLIGWGVLAACGYDTVNTVRILFSGRNTYALLRPELQPFGPLLRLLCMAGALLMTLALLCLMPGRKLPVLTACGARTFGVYFWHMPVLYVLQACGVGALLAQTAAGRWAFLALAVPILLLLSLPPFDFPTGTIRRHLRQDPAGGSDANKKENGGS